MEIKKSKKCGKIKMVTTPDSTPVQKSQGVVSNVSKPTYGSPPTSVIKSFNDITITPSEAPTVDVLRSQDFKSSLVEIESANIIKGFCKEVKPKCGCDPVKPEPECPSCHPEKVEETCINHKATPITEATGKELDFSWKNAVEVKCATLLMRCGNRLAKLSGCGALWLEKGKVCVRKNIPLKVSTLWHKWFLPTPNSSPIIGQPMPFPYQVVTDIDGNPHVIQGLADEDSITVWDHTDGHFYQKPVTDFPLCVRQKLQSANRLELVGFEPLGIGDDPSLLRCLKKIQGEGILTFKTIQTTPSDICECDSCESTGQQMDTTTVAEFIPNPTAECTDGCPWLLGFDANTGTHQYYDASQVECLKGKQGESIKGDKGDSYDPSTSTCC